MTIRFLCPTGHRLSVPDSSAGTKVRCARCKKVARVPNAPGPSGESDSAAASSSGEPKNTVAPSSAVEPQKQEVPPRKPKAKPPVRKPAASRAKPPPLPSKRKSAGSKSGRHRPKSAAPETETDPKTKPDAKPETETKPAEKKKRFLRRKTARDRKRSKRPREKPAATGGPQAEEKPPQPVAEPPKPSKTRRGPKLMPADVYVPDQGKIASVKWLAAILTLAVLFSIAPVVWQGQLNLGKAESQWWARLVLLMAAVQAVYIVWMLNRPDWASVWVVMLVFAAVAALYGMASAITIMWPELDEPMPLGLEPIRQSARAWCAAVLLTTSLATYLCGRTSAKWRRQLELETAGRGRTPR